MMPDREKVIAWLADEELYYRDHVDTHNSLMACNALDLLKEREETTFKPHYIAEYGKHFICGVECGACHKEISSTYHYCPWCGRVVKWK